jgi:manganese efflux pump family protein
MGAPPSRRLNATSGVSALNPHVRDGSWRADYLSSVLALLLVAFSVGLDNFGAATALGIAGVDRNLRIRVAVIFGVFEAAMPVVGLVLGHSLAHRLGGASKPIAGGLLCLAGAYAIINELTGESEDAPDRDGVGTRRLVLIGAGLSTDNIVIGFALGTYDVNILAAAILIATVSVALSLVGLEVGSRLGERLGRRAELVGGVVLILVGVAVGTGLL